MADRGYLLVCRERGPDTVVLGLAHRDATFTPLTEGPFDVAAQPLERPDLEGCGIAPR